MEIFDVGSKETLNTERKKSRQFLGNHAAVDLKRRPVVYLVKILKDFRKT